MNAYNSTPSSTADSQLASLESFSKMAEEFQASQRAKQAEARARYLANLERQDGECLKVVEMVEEIGTQYRAMNAALPPGRRL